jgi:hypothetical protein
VLKETKLKKKLKKHTQALKLKRALIKGHLHVAALKHTAVRGRSSNEEPSMKEMGQEQARKRKGARDKETEAEARA